MQLSGTGHPRPGSPRVSAIRIPSPWATTTMTSHNEEDRARSGYKYSMALLSQDRGCTALELPHITYQDLGCNAVA